MFVLARGAPFNILESLVLGSLLSAIRSKKTRFFIANINHNDLVVLKDLVEAARVLPVIDRRYPLSNVAGALRYLEEHHARGKIVITVASGGSACFFHRSPQRSDLPDEYLYSRSSRNNLNL
jgi:Zinc-binding dehydrogenase